MTKFSILALACLLSTALINANPISQRVSSFVSQKETKYRLPTNTVPRNYTVGLTTRIDDEKFDFTGKVEIVLETTEKTDHITLHMKALEIISVALECGGEDIKDPKQTYDTTTQFLKYELGKEVEADTECVLTIQYKGTLREDNGGFYRSSYTDDKGKTRWLATTQFESTDARHGFPCYDEPGIRATFDISITFGGYKEDKTGFNAISNMEILDTIDNKDGTFTTTFAQTPAVQPYLIAFVVSDFLSIEKKDTGKVPQKLFARPAAITAKEGEYGLETGVEVLTEQAKYFGHDYSLKKMDQISIPDFQAGAMENWGLVTYRESALLYNKEYHALDTKRRIAGIIAHEFAHQWFGNLVAPEWWSYLWLNEGFANMYQYYTVSTLYEEFDQMGFFIFEVMQNAMESDALETTRPMTHDVEEPTAIRNLFDDIAYGKSGSFLRMVQCALTDEVFQKGLEAYLEAKQYQAATPDDLSAALQTVVKDLEYIPAEVTMKKLIDSWSLKAGYPLITVTRDDDNKITLTQRKFSFKVTEDADDDETWIVPINMATASDPDFDDTKPMLWLTEDTLEIEPEEEPEPEKRAWTKEDWIVLNKQETGFYRVNYEGDLWTQIVAKMNSEEFEEIHEYNRAQLVDDVLNLARANIKDYASVFSLLDYMKAERNFVPWASASSGLLYLQRQLLGTESYEHFNHFVHDMVEPLYAELGAHDKGEDEKLPVKHLRSIAINWACRSGNDKCISDTKDRVKEVIDDPEKEIEPDVRYVVYCNGLREATETEYDAIVKRLEAEDDQGERTILINALACIQDSDLQKKFLASSIVDKPIKYRAQERNLVLKGVYASGQTGLENSMEFIGKNHKKIQEKYSPPSPVKTTVIAMSERITSKDLNTKFEELMETLTTAKYFTEEEKTKVLETPAENIAWTEANEGEIRKFFTDYYKGAGTAPILSTLFLGIFLVIGYLLQ